MYKYVIIFLIFIYYESIPQSYNIFYGGKKVSTNYYQPVKIFEILKPAKGDYIENQFYVKTKFNMSESELEKELYQSLYANGIRNIEFSNVESPFKKYFPSELLSNSKYNLDYIFRVTYMGDTEVFEICKLLSSNLNYEYIVPAINYKLLDSKPNDSRINSQWYMDSIKIFQSWDKTKGTKSIIIGIVDSGTDLNHEDLKSQVWTNPNEIPSDGIDNDGNGFIDDVNGWDFVGNINLTDAILGNFKPDNNPVPILISNDHGTHVAGTAAATTNNNLGIASTGYDVRFISTKNALDDLNKSRLVYRPFEAMMYLASMGAKVINCSWASSYYDPLAWDVVNELLDNNVSIVASAGNEDFWTDFYQYYPATIPGVISVGSVNNQGTRSYFSNYGVRVNCFAPGEAILSTVNDNRYSSKNGTSMSSPVVSGFITNLVNRFPNYDNKQIFHQIRSTLTKFDNQTPLLSGKLNCLSAINYNYAGTGLNIPGIEISSIEIDGNSSINNFGNTRIKLNIINYLSNAQNVIITLSPQDDYFTFSESKINLTVLNSEQNVAKEIDFILRDNCPWFEGEATVFVKIESGNYINYQLIDIPIILKSNNKHILASNFPESDNFRWYESAVGGDFHHAVVGYDLNSKRGIIHQFSTFTGVLSPTKDTVTCIDFFDDLNYIVGSNGVDGKTEIFSYFGTISKDISQYLSSIKDLSFKDKDNGYIIGIDANSSLPAVLYTNNGGNSFIKTNIPGITNLDKFSTNISKRENLNLWGTVNGRIIYTPDGGKSANLINTKLGNYIMMVEAISIDTFFVFSYNSNSGFKLHKTLNKGITFIDITPNEIDLTKAVKIFIPDGSNHLYIVMKDTRIYKTVDMGNNWLMELNKQYKLDGFSHATLFSKSGRARLWMSGFDIRYLDFEYLPQNVVYDLKIAGKQNLDFDTLKIFDSYEETIFLKNNGNYKATIESQEFSSGEVFSLSLPFKTIISPGELASADLKFAPEKVGLFYDTLTIKTTEGNQIIKFVMQGVGDDPSNMVEGPLKYDFNISKLGEVYLIKSDDFFQKVTTLTVSDLQGNKLTNYRISPGEKYVELDFSKYPQSVYVVNLTNELFSKTFKIIEIK